MRRLWWGAAAFAVYVAAIAGSNWLITHVGVPAGHGTFLTPVGFGLMAPSGVWAASLSFPARDVVQRILGSRAGLAAIAVGAVISWVISSPVIAVASATTYLISEGLDMAVYTPLQRRWFVRAVVASWCLAAVVDSAVFLRLAHIWSWSSFAGLCVGKLWMVGPGALAAWRLRRAGPVAVPA